jgi:hypothetical protein
VRTGLPEPSTTERRIEMTDEQREALHYLMLDDSDKIIRYLEEKKSLKRKSSTFMTVVTVLGAVGSLIAAITGVIILLQ